VLPFRLAASAGATDAARRLWALAALPALGLSVVVTANALRFDPEPATAWRLHELGAGSRPALFVAVAGATLALADALLEALGGDTMDGLRPAFARLRLSARTRPGHVWLVGPMGSGKTEAGRRLAVLLGLPFVDLDAKVEERAGRSVAELFRTEGEARFRALEAEAVGSAAKGPVAVVGTGGGVVLGDAAWRTMRSSGVVLGLTARKETLLGRLAGQTAHRPLLAGDAGSALEKVLGERRHLYRRADLTLDTEGLPPDGVAGALVGLLRSLQGPLVRPGAVP
jgi:shikimate kinase